ncbi:GNAT family N-acetyltransferase [Asanoa siamensis]|uniref:N-acetyltransferase n=1 Tax=Asanoa siamensis TaxID=926357 RepID=A0ABQ4CWZ8_9ACTN|nr:GNAT family N-acetyltransferase [Asanoa siamensis]GIF75799.1 N-acetyltransferase [Asanoa siamensis]
MTVTIRRGTTADGPALAGLRWRRLTEERGYGGTDRAEFVGLFSEWLVRNSATHLPFVALGDADELVGMAWLMIADRVPTPKRRTRRSGDVQSVYVVPDLRGAGVGRSLMDSVLAEARALGLEHVTVHSSPEAVPFYERTGFAHDPEWLRWLPE